MRQTILITGGAGFIGSHLADELLSRGFRVRALDNLSPQVHGEGGRRPVYLNPDVELLVGDVRDPHTVRAALHGVDAVYHFAAAVGVGQSMYQLENYISVNNVGTAVLLQELAERPIRRLIVASSMSIYGEGLYRAASDVRDGVERSPVDLRVGHWEPRDVRGGVLEPVATPESKPPMLNSIYALSKYDQERMCLMIGQTRGLPTVALRFFNAYGPRQALSNPYTGVLAIFAARLLNGRRPLIFEDGNQKRDFVSVHDVAAACHLALEAPEAPGHVFNIGSGVCRSVREVATEMALALGKPHLTPEITERCRVGDIRHCFADISRAARVLGYQPRVDFAAGLRELVDWLRRQTPVDHAEAAQAELTARGLTV
jgi:dTDP-L-rhamnose 4-epimerase